MAVRPTKIPIATATTGWDAPVEQNTDILFDGPLPLFREADFATLANDFPADEYDQCLAITEDTGVVYMSDGTTWNRLIPQMPNDAAPTATTLRDALVTAGLMAS